GLGARNDEAALARRIVGRVGSHGVLEALSVRLERGSVAYDARPRHARRSGCAARRHPSRCARMNPSVGAIPSNPIEVRVDRNTVLPGRAWCAPQPRALVAIVHRLGDDSGRSAALAADLHKARFTTVCLDLPGHGEAPRPRGDARSWTELRDLAVPAMFSASRGLPGQPPDMPHILFGHSMGGLMALDYAL